MLATLLLSLPAIAGTPTVTWTAPERYIEGVAYQVEVSIEVPADGAALKGWALTPAGFMLDGKPMAARKGNSQVEFAPGTTLSLSLDLAPAIEASKSYKRKPFKLAFDSAYSDVAAREVEVMRGAPKGLNFMEMAPEELKKYNVVLETSRGTMVAMFYPENAPNHVRNFLDLCYTGFYDGLIFHRVIPGFMIQGGDPTGTGSGSGPRTLKAEFSRDPKYKHVRGVLSMARLGGQPDSATSQFFVMHASYPSLDGQYSVFGKVYEGLETIDAIVTSPRGARDKPNVDQVIRKATVILAE